MLNALPSLDDSGRCGKRSLGALTHLEREGALKVSPDLIEVVRLEQLAYGSRRNSKAPPLEEKIRDCGNAGGECDLDGQPFFGPQAKGLPIGRDKGETQDRERGDGVMCQNSINAGC